MAGSPGEVQAACEDAVAALAGAFAGSTVAGSRLEWAGVVGSLQRVLDVAAAAQDAAIVRLAAVEAEVLEDGTVVESHRAPGHVAVDAPAIVSGVLAVTAVHAERRVRAAVHLAADGPGGTGTETGLGGLHEAMRTGRLDPYRAGVVAEELEQAPPEVRATVVAALAGHLAVEDGAHLRRRCRRALARISPDLLRQRAVRARAQSGLRRWAEEPGVDRWEGTFPSEDAARAWAAIDALARRYVAEQVCATIERARAQALTDLVAGHATVETVVTLTVPATALPEDGRTVATGPEARPVPQPRSATDPDVRPGPAGTRSDVGDGDLVEVTGLHGTQPVLVSRTWLATTVADQHSLDTASCHPLTGALLDQDHAPDAHEDAAPVGAHTEHEIEADDGHDVRVAAVVGADRYRPAARLVKLVRARDRRCRFPGCTVAAVFCDLDHVRPWPLGPTTAENLMCLCRRHHRVKQRPGWRVILAADGPATWTDPTGHVRTTEPVNALQVTVLTGGSSAVSPAGETCTGARPAENAADDPASRPRTVVPDGPHSELEFVLEHLGAGPPRAAGVRRGHHAHHRPVLVPQPARLILDPGGHRARSRRDRGRCPDVDEPPF
ncbi:MAG TPA: HNH endonuclease signature motif containing protein [Ornithinibacter sp.]|nr:HNH endonuclease signature motif containing protein [Ornithinibacter sp.]